MAKKVLRSDLELNGIAPNLLLKDIEVTAPFLFKGELNLEGKNRAYLAKLVFYKKNLNALKYINLTEYFYVCMAAHWTTAGTFVPTNVDNQIREGLWKHKEIQAHIDRMARITIESWNWDYEQVTNRKAYNPGNGQVMSTHEGTWLSVAIGAYCALVKHKKTELAEEVANVILAEIEKEEKLLIELREKRDHVNFLRSTALMAHNFGDLDRVIDQWEMPEDDSFRKRIYKLGHIPNVNYSPILAFAGQVNKRFLSVENHRHMSMRQAKCLRRSYKFLIPVGPFMDTWGETLAGSNLLSMEEKGEIVAALYEGFKRQDQAFGYARAFRGMMSQFPRGIDSLEADLPFDLVAEIRKSRFNQIAELPREEFEADFGKSLEAFVCPITSLKF
ncbi:hypothetical protein [Peredibacter starrii]|uniref:Uncharacterized protein n=1 Tax=Peredibacter starrii TaxID=28202 RepID=A0AAX4HTC0_9BACT|nr:hypothetical protein [Peredibacter starrii]WPU66457.1 hypothetical protein SOO65_06830 [Peredibacter starrii]